MTLFLQNMEKSVPSDPELLADWLSQQREPAFHALVARYAGLVHATAKRTCGDESMAAEASQLTFIALAQKAKSLTSCASLGGWLHTTAMMQAKNLSRKSQRESRKRQLLQAAMETEPPHASNDVWKEMQPVLDEALAALSDKDREAVLLRFYRSLSIREIAATLGIATDAAQKRIDRATERLRGKLARRGVQTSGTLSAAMLAGFAADAQAAVLPVSILASKAIAAGAVSTFSLSAIIISIAAFMKAPSLIPPVVALILAGAWTGTKYHSLSATEARNGLLRDEIAEARSVKTPTPIKVTNDDGSIDWDKLAAEEGVGPEMRRFQKRLTSMSLEEMSGVLDQIAALEVSKDRRIELESAVIGPLAKIDPAWVLEHFKDRLLDSVDQRNLRLEFVFQTWAKADLMKATAWFDLQISSGNFDGKQLDEDRRSQSRNLFEASLMAVLLAVDPAAADLRLSVIPESQRSYLMFHLSHQICDTTLENGNHLAFTNLVRNHLPKDQQASILLDACGLMEGEFPKLIAYMDKVEAAPAERIACLEIYSAGCIVKLSGQRKVTVDDLKSIRERFAEISPAAVDNMTANSLIEAAKIRHTSMLFPQAAGLAVELAEASGNDAVLTRFLEIAPFDKMDKNLGRELAAKISDETRREEILKRFK